MLLMDSLSWNTLLFASKWLFVGLIYLVFFVILIAVRREFSYRVESRRSAGPSSPGRLKVLTTGSGNRLQVGAVIDLVPDTTLGAEPGNDVILDDAYVSGKHARLNWDGANWWVEDLGSRNGTFITGRRCQPHTPQILPTGGILKIGDISFELVI
jgi:hypothetical protein